MGKCGSFSTFLRSCLFTNATDAWLVRGEAMEDREEERRKRGQADIGPRGGLIIADPEDRSTPWGPPLFVLFPSYTNARSTTDI